MQKVILSTSIILLLSSCAEEIETPEFYQFRKQITPSGKYVIYDYARSGAMSFSSDIYGRELFEIDEKFSQGKGKKIDGAISEWLSNDTLLVFNFNSNSDQPKDTLPIKVEHSKLGDFVVKTVYYKRNAFYSSSSYFDSVETTNDSIFIHLVKDNQKKPNFTLSSWCNNHKSKSGFDNTN